MVSNLHISLAYRSADRPTAPLTQQGLAMARSGKERAAAEAAKATEASAGECGTSRLLTPRVVTELGF